MKKRATLLYPLLTTLLLTACGGGGGSGGSEKPTEPTRAAGLYMTAINNPVSLTVKSVASSNRMALKAAKAEIVTPEDGEQIDPSVGLYATDEGGKEFRIHFELTAEDGTTTGYDEKINPTSVIQITPDAVYLELAVKVNTNSSVEIRQYLVQFSTGKMIEVQRLALRDAFLNQAYKYVIPANSLHNGSNDPIVLLSDGKWYSLSADWTNGAVSKEYRSDYVSTYGSQGPAGNILFTADKQEYRIEHGAVGGDNDYITHNNQVLYRGNSGFWLADDGRVVVANNGGLFHVVTIDGVESLEQFSDYTHDAALGDVLPITYIWAKSGEYLLSTQCQVNRDNAGIMEMPFFNSWDTDSYYTAGAQSMVCVDKPDNDQIDMLDPEVYCNAGLEWRMWTLSVDGAAKREITPLAAEPFQIIQLSEDTAYAGLSECVKDAEGKWTVNFTNNIINFADNSITPVSDIVSLSAFIH
ncbi:MULTISPECIES: hypothetical protein [Aeromonas]|uniref:hypothetical protein n=1 Tax=Aeromonas TaxID=642 RepID=UPI000CDD85FB|nr:MULTISPECIES: hypothetical protein [Aeromonas]AUZ76701.1 hypothetical protein C2U40_18930 [Aeromonas sp. ASNIH4]POU40311.1 hypothetical protein C3405_06350 [Aeromonas hydrophila]POV89750.1 hypothetical protein C3395_06985 [Aeromonas sp. ASNIH6]